MNDLLKSFYKVAKVNGLVTSNRSNNFLFFCNLTNCQQIMSSSLLAFSNLSKCYDFGVIVIIFACIFMPTPSKKCVVYEVSPVILFQFVVHLPVVHLCHLLHTCSFVHSASSSGNAYDVYLWHHHHSKWYQKTKLCIFTILELCNNF